MQRTQTQGIDIRPSVSRYESTASCSCLKCCYKHRSLSNPQSFRKGLILRDTIKQSLRVWAVRKKGSFKPSTFPHLRATGGLHHRLPVRKSSDSRGISTLKLGGWSLSRGSGRCPVLLAGGQEKPQRIQPNMLLLQHLPHLAKEELRWFIRGNCSTSSNTSSDASGLLSKGA